MYSSSAVIFALDAIIQVVESDGGYRWHLDPRVPGLLRDYQALGYRLIGILDPEQFGLVVGESADHVELIAYVDSLFKAAKAPALHAVHLTDDVSDPRPIWDLRRQLGISLDRSVLLGTGEVYEVLQENAGIGQLEWAEDVLGTAYQPLVKAAS